MGWRGSHTVIRYQVLQVKQLANKKGTKIGITTPGQYRPEIYVNKEVLHTGLAKFLCLMAYQSLWVKYTKAIVIEKQ